MSGWQVDPLPPKQRDRGGIPLAIAAAVLFIGCCVMVKLAPNLIWVMAGLWLAGAIVAVIAITRRWGA